MSPSQPGFSRVAAVDFAGDETYRAGIASFSLKRVLGRGLEVATLPNSSRSPCTTRPDGAAIPIANAMPFVGLHIRDLDKDQAASKERDRPSVGAKVAPSTVLILQKETLPANLGPLAQALKIPSPSGRRWRGSAVRVKAPGGGLPLFQRHPSSVSALSPFVGRSGIRFHLRFNRFMSDSKKLFCASITRR